MYTKFKIVDNSGGKELLCIRVLRGTTEKYRIGDMIVGAVKGADSQSSIKNGQVIKAVIVCLRKPVIRKDGTTVRSSCNGVVLLNDNGLIGERILVPVAQETSRSKYAKTIQSRAKEVF